MFNKFLSTRAIRHLVLIVAMLATTLMLSPPADAQTGASCIEGVFDGTQCVIQGAPPVPGPATCPVSASVMLDGAECFTLVSELQVCPPGSADVNGECRKPVADLPGSTSCSAGFGLVDGECIRFEAPSLTCTDGELVGENCEIIGAQPVQGPPTCPVSATVLQDGEECYTLIAPPAGPATCDAPYIAFGSICKTNNTGTTAAEIFAFTCPPGPAGAIITENMHTVGGIAKIESCSYTPANSTGECPAGTTPDPNGVDCRRPVDLRPGALMCESGFGLINGQCVRYENAVLACATGDLVGLQCVIVGPPPVTSPATCPPGSSGVPGACYLVVPGVSVCPPGTTLDPSGVDCRLPVDLVPGALMCEAGFGLIDGGCFRFEPVTYLCNGLVVTINMVTGASGQGTSGNDVILGTSGADTISGRGGDDVICARGGADLVFGGAGNDLIYGQGGGDDIRAGTGNDLVYGGGGNDIIRGNAGDDDLRGNAGDDDLRGGSNNDIIRGGNGDDSVRGNSGDDTLRGNAGTDACIGGSGADTAAASCEAVTSVP